MSAKTIAMIFPGQGSQAAGMGKALAEAHPCAKAIFDEADAVLGRPLSTLCFEGPDDELKKTLNTQPALYVTSAAALAVLRQEGVEPSIVAGHSLGEYSALYAAGVLDFATGLKLVAARGQAMWDAGNARPGAMAALLSLDGAKVKEICNEASNEGCCVAANWNSPEQIVVSGDPAAVEKAVELAKAAGSRRSVMLPVSGAFHSPLVEPAVEVMKPELDAATFAAPQCKFVANVSAKLTNDPAAIRQGLADQIVSCVLWYDSIQTILGEKPDVFVEAGSGKVLSGLMRRIDRSVKALPFGEPAQLDAIKEALA